MQIRRVAAPASCVYSIAARFKTELAGNPSVLWLLSGGSNIEIEVKIMNEIDASLSTRLTVALMDERFGPTGHPDSNWQQLIDAGFDHKQATAVPVLQGQATLADAVQSYTTTMTTLLATHPFIIGLFGMGADGHVSGILPHSPATSADGFVTGYHTEDYDRITTTFDALRRCSVGYLLAFGDAKHTALTNLQNDVSLVEQPAQILKQLPEAYIYNDHIGESG